MKKEDSLFGALGEERILFFLIGMKAASREALRQNEVAGA
jgi:hypothetical protein